MSVWDTFSASLHMVQEKLEQVLEDTPTEQEEEEVGKGKVGLRDGVCVCGCVESVCVHMYALRRRQWERGRWDCGTECVCVRRVCVYMCMH